MTRRGRGMAAVMFQCAECERWFMPSDLARYSGMRHFCKSCWDRPGVTAGQSQHEEHQMKLPGIDIQAEESQPVKD